MKPREMKSVFCVTDRLAMQVKMMMMTMLLFRDDDDDDDDDTIFIWLVFVGNITGALIG